MSRTLDEILAEAGVTREEWQRARVVVEDYWRFHAQANGWVEAKEPSQKALWPAVLQFPIATGRTIRIELPEPPLLTTEEWERLLSLLEAMRPGLVLDPQATAPAVATKEGSE